MMPVMEGECWKLLNSNVVVLRHYHVPIDVDFFTAFERVVVVPYAIQSQERAGEGT